MTHKQYISKRVGRISFVVSSLNYITLTYNMQVKSSYWTMKDVTMLLFLINKEYYSLLYKLHTSYATLSSGILWDIPRVTCIFSVYTRAFLFFITYDTYKLYSVSLRNFY